jgi:hypothetical protein
MTNICCPNCNNESFEIIITKMKGEKDKILVLHCLACKQPAGVIRSEASIKLIRALAGKTY